MIQGVWVARARLPDGRAFIIVKVPAGTVLTTRAAERVVNALRAILPTEQLVLEIVVTDDGPDHSRIAFASSADLKAYVREVLPRLASNKWQRAKLDW